jgi:predicted protein tyrosine phosphatase
VENKLRVLFVCASNQWRSPTAEVLYRNDQRLEVRSAGVCESSRHRVNSEDLQWAHVVFAMEQKHKKRIQEHFRDIKLPPIEVLDIPDDLEYMNPKLQRMLREALDPELEALLQSSSPSEVPRAAW